jgi:hypothetical protein
VPDVKRETNAMLSGMMPALTEEEFVFCTTGDAEIIARIGASAFSWIREEEGITLILTRSAAKSLGFDDSKPMRRIVLQVFSALDGVGLTAAVATALATEGIPCNMIAGYHHDHVFVPSAMADRAVTVLRDLQVRSTK